MVPITGRASSFLEFFLFLKTPISIQIKSKSNPILFFCSSFFLCLQGEPEQCGSYHLLQSYFSFFVRLHGQPELFGSYHLLQSCFSFFVRLHGQPEPFGSCIILQSCSFFFFRLHGQPELFASDHLFQSYFSLSSPLFNLLRVDRSCFSWSSVSDDLFYSSCSFLVLLPALSFSRLILSLSFLCSSVSEALFALSFSFLSERCLFVFVHAKAALAYSRNEYYGCHRSILTGLMKVELKIPSRSCNLHFVSNSQN